jgi:predicted protein tyrosine phosphatase
MRLLFVCNLGRNRSRTAAEVMSGEYETNFKGTIANTVSSEDIHWTDLIICMEKDQENFVLSHFPEAKGRTKVLGIENAYRYDDPELKELIKEKMKKIMGDT